MQILISKKGESIDLRIDDRLEAENINMDEALSLIDRAYSKEIQSAAELINQYMAAADAAALQIRHSLEKIQEICTGLRVRHEIQGEEQIWQRS